MNLLVDVNSDNEAMQHEMVVKNILLDIVSEINHGEHAGIIRDRNGNTVGRWMLNLEEEHSVKV
jgi:hypothetical protein